MFHIWSLNGDSILEEYGFYGEELSGEGADLECRKMGFLPDPLRSTEMQITSYTICFRS